MSSKEIALDLVRKLPDEASLMEFARKIEFVAGIREAMDEFDRGESISADQLIREIPEWLKDLTVSFSPVHAYATQPRKAKAA